MDNHEVKGRIHSIETLGTLDGPGVRVVVFFQGCSFRCIYCHNPDTWDINQGKEYSIDELMQIILRYKNYITNGGVTLSGGEPLLQHEFVLNIINECKREGIHTAIDTSGLFDFRNAKDAILNADLILIDIKHTDADMCKKVTGMGNENTFELIRFCEDNRKEMWIRHVVTPKTDDAESIDKLARYTSQYKYIKKLQLLPMHKMGEKKWESLGFVPPAKDMKEPTEEFMSELKSVISKYNF